MATRTHHTDRRRSRPQLGGMRPTFVADPFLRQVTGGTPWRSIQRILQLPSDTRLFSGHDYRPNGRSAAWESTVAAQKAHNLHVKNFNESKFVKLRTERDRSLPMPTLMLSALQVNLAGGRLPPPETGGRRYLKIPVNAFPQASWG